MRITRIFEWCDMSSHELHDPLLGSEHGIGKDRRRFIVISLFDCTLTSLLWLICTVSKGDNWSATFLQEIDIFEANFFKISLFDVVLVAVFRMVYLIICYAICRVNHWFPVALSTTISTIYLTLKVMFFFSKSQGGLPQYLLILSSFSIAWFELWLMPFRVLPRERAAEREIDNESMRVDRAESVNNIVQVRSASRQGAFHLYSEAEFHSALDFSSASEEESAMERSERTVKNRIAIKNRAEYELRITVCEEATEDLLCDARGDTWKPLRTADPTVRQSQTGIYYVRAVFSCTPQLLFDAVWKDNLKWNDQVLEGKSVLSIDETTELYYSVSAPALRGYIASRDFLDVRRVKFDSAHSTFTGFFTHCDASILPPNSNKKIVRGYNGPAVIRVCAGADGLAVFEWVMQTDLKGGLPKRLVQSSMLTFFVQYVDKLRKYIAIQGTV